MKVGTDFPHSSSQNFLFYSFGYQLQPYISHVNNNYGRCTLSAHYESVDSYINRPLCLSLTGCPDTHAYICACVHAHSIPARRGRHNRLASHLHSDVLLIYADCMYCRPYFCVRLRTCLLNIYCGPYFCVRRYILPLLKSCEATAGIALQSEPTSAYIYHRSTIIDFMMTVTYCAYRDDNGIIAIHKEISVFTFSFNSI